MGVQHLRFGPVDSRMRGFRFYFWPQARNKVGEAVAELVAAGEDDAALAARIGRASVAVQGLLAAEVLLYDDRYSAPTRRDAGCSRPWQRTCAPWRWVSSRSGGRATTPSPN